MVVVGLVYATLVVGEGVVLIYTVQMWDSGVRNEGCDVIWTYTTLQ